MPPWANDHPSPNYVLAMIRYVLFHDFDMHFLVFYAL